MMTADRNRSSDKRLISLSRTFLLTRFMTGGSRIMASGIESKPRTATKKVLIAIAYVFMFVYLLGLVAVFAWSATDVLQSVGMEGVFPEILISMTAMMSIVFGVYYLISIFYHADETTYILALPFRTTELVAAKFLQTLVFEYLITGMLFLPAMLAFAIKTAQGVGFYLMLLPLTLLLPVIPLALLTLVVMLLMRIVPFAKNKDRVTMFMNIVMLVFVLAISFGMSQPISEEDLLELMLGGGTGGLVTITAVSRYIPGLGLAIRAMAENGQLSGWVSLLLFTVICLVAFALVVLVGRLFYLDTLLALSAGGRKKRRYERASLRRESRSKGQFPSYFAKEMRLLIRTPAYFMNNILSAVILPVLLLVMPFMYGDFKELLGLLPDFSGWIGSSGDTRFFIYAILIGVTIYQLSFGSLNSVACTAISREGSQAFVMKYLPVTYSIQFMAKLAPGILLAVLPTFMILILFTVLASVPLSFVLVTTCLIIVSSVLMNIVGLLFDVWMPKLRWENETQAVKNNMNAIWSMLVGFVLCLIPILIAVWFWSLDLAAIWLVLAVLAVLILLTVLSWTLLLRFGTKKITEADW